MNRRGGLLILLDLRGDPIWGPTGEGPPRKFAFHITLGEVVSDPGVRGSMGTGLGLWGDKVNGKVGVVKT